MKYHKNDRINEMIRQKVREGWSVGIGKHLKIRHPQGGIVSMSITPSDGFFEKKVLADVARLERRIADRMKKVSNG